MCCSHHCRLGLFYYYLGNSVWESKLEKKYTIEKGMLVVDGLEIHWDLPAQVRILPTTIHLSHAHFINCPNTTAMPLILIKKESHFEAVEVV